MHSKNTKESDKIRDCHQTSCLFKIQETWLENWWMYQNIFLREILRGNYFTSHDYLMSLT